MSRRHVSVCVLVVYALIAIGCGRSPEAKKAWHLERGEQYFKQERYPEAAIEYRNVLELDPHHAQAAFRLGVAYYQQGKIDQAYPFLLETVERDANNLDAREKLGQIYLAARQMDRARDEAEFILDADPARLGALILLAATAQTPEQRANAIWRLEAAATRFADRAPLHVALGRLYLATNDLARAEGHFKEAVAKDPKSVEAHFALGAFYLAQRDLTAAETAFQMGAASAPIRSPARIRLADFYLVINRPDQAKKILNKITEQAPDFLPAWQRVADLALTEGRYDDSARAVDAILARRPSDPAGLLLRGRIRLARQEVDAAIQDFQSVLQSDPSFNAARLHLAQAHIHAGEIVAAKRELHEALQREPNFVKARLVLAELNLRTGAVRLALQDLEQVIQQNPGLIEAYPLLGAAYLAERQPAKANGAYARFAAAVPKDPRGPYLVGTALRAQGKVADARKAFEAALALKPDFLEPLTQLVALDLDLKRAQAAVERMSRQIARYPDSPGLQQLLGDVYAHMRDVTSAEAAYLKSAELDPKRIAPYLRLANLYAASGKPGEALRRLDAAVAVNPGDVRAYMFAGLIHEQSGDVSSAQKAYQRALEINPRFAPAANNLAWLMTEHGGDRERALELAQTARNAAPQDPNIADTLGWVLYKHGRYDAAIELLEESAGTLKNNPVIHYHLGMAHSKVGNNDAAQKALQVAVRSREDFAGKSEARTTLAALK
jgi:tetratricopeptide (TPR) repeat protein